MPRNVSARSLSRRTARTATVTSATVGLLLMTAGLASAQGGAENPLNGIKPDMSVFGGAFNETWARVAAGIWGGSF